MEYSLVCPACAAEPMQIFFQLDNAPVHQNLPLPDRLAAQQCRWGTIKLSFCSTCGFIANLAFDPEQLNYSPEYENAQSCSPLFQAYMQDLANYLVKQYKLYDRRIIEIGCGKGEFLKMLCDLGHNQGIGFDPAALEEDTSTLLGVTFIRDFYSAQYADYQGDFFCSRHTLEHVPYPAELIKTLRASIQDNRDVVVFFEVPNVVWILRNLTFWDIFYEHCSYFSPGSLTRLFTRCGFQVKRVTEAFGGQYLWLETAVSTSKFNEAQGEIGGVENVATLAQAVHHFTVNYQDKVAELRRMFTEIERQGQRCVIWGAGAKGVSLLNMLQIPLNQVEFVVDINPRKQGLYVPGAGQKIVPPDFLKSYSPDVIMIMNPNYRAEIRDTVAEMGITAKFISI